MSDPLPQAPIEQNDEEKEEEFLEKVKKLQALDNGVSEMKESFDEAQRELAGLRFRNKESISSFAYRESGAFVHLDSSLKPKFSDGSTFLLESPLAQDNKENSKGFLEGLPYELISDKFESLDEIGVERVQAQFFLLLENCLKLVNLKKGL